MALYPAIPPAPDNLSPCPPPRPRPGADAEFLRAAFRLSRNSVYSLHKSSTRDFIQRLAERELRARSGAAGCGEPARAAAALQRSLLASLRAKTMPHALRVTPPAAEVLAQLRYDLPPTYKFHKQKSRDIEVDLWRFEVPAHTDS